VNFGNALKTVNSDVGFTAASFAVNALPTGVQGGTISGTYRLTALASQASMAMNLSSFSYIAGATYKYTFTGLVGSVALSLTVLQNTSTGIVSTATANVSTGAQTITGFFTTANTGGNLAFNFQAGSANPFVNWTGFSLTRTDTEVQTNLIVDGNSLLAGNVGIGTTNPSSLLHIKNSNSNDSLMMLEHTEFLGADKFIRLKSGGYGHSIGMDNNTLVFSAKGDTIFGMMDFRVNDGTKRAMFIGNGGNVGIGIPTVGYGYYNAKLAIEQGLGNNNNGLFISNTNYGSMQGLNISMVNAGSGNFFSYASLQGYNVGVAASTPIALQPTGGNVGIGIVPETPLHVNGGNSQFVITYAPDTASRCWFKVGDGGNLFIHPTRVGSGNSSVLPGVDAAINLGANSWRWVSLFASNGVIQTSDSNQKDAQALPYGLNEILKIRTIKYKWKSQASLPDSDPNKNFEYYGFCADELAPVFPELVYDEDKNAPIQMNYSELLPVVVNALKEEHAIVERQRQQILDLNTRLSRLESLLSR
jgi:hypothetical protein